MSWQVGFHPFILWMHWIVFPQYWLVGGAEKTFEGHLNVIKATYCHPKVCKDTNKVEHWVPPMMNADDLDS